MASAMFRTPPFSPAQHPPRAIALVLPAPQPRTWLRWLAAGLLAAAAATGLMAQVAINTTGAAPAGNAMLDIQSTTKGLLIPRMTYAQRNSLSTFAPLPTSATLDGLLVYQTDSTGTTPRGYYYYDNTTPQPGWRHIAWGAPIWQLGGNAGTTSANFLGTTNAMPLTFRTHSQERGRITDTGELQFYYTGAVPPPTEIVEVQGGIKLDGGSEAVNHEGTIRYTPGSGNVPGKFEGYVVNTPAGDTRINGWKQIDNNFGERKIQDSPILGLTCQPPSSDTDPSATPRPWPSPGPTAFVSSGGALSPYYTTWEDGHRQYLYRAADLAAAGICPGSTNPIRAIAFNVTSVSGGSGRIHFLRFRMKNTGATSITAFDMAGLSDFAQPGPPGVAGPPLRYYNPYPPVPAQTYPGDHTTGYLVTNGWNVHPYSDGITPALPGTGFVWGGGNLLIDAALDDQEWTNPSINSGSIQVYTAAAQSSIYMYCDACGGASSGSTASCFWNTTPPASFYYPPTTPTNGIPAAVGGNWRGWGYTGGWNLVGGVNTYICDGDPTPWGGGGPPTVGNQLPRVAFLCTYIGGGAAYNVGNYMYSENGVMIGDAAWAASGIYPNEKFRGPGTISAQKSVWSDASLLSDFVFDQYYDGTTKPEDAEGVAQYLRTPLAELPNYVERNRHLPTIPGRSQWEKTGTFSVDKLTNSLWVTVEDQALYIKELNQRMDALQQFLVEKKLKELEGK